MQKKRESAGCSPAWDVAGLFMLPEGLQEILKTQCWYANPMSELVYDRQFKDLMQKYDKYENFLSACGHDTHELAGAMARARAALQELNHVNEWMDNKFKENPFPFMTGGAADAGEIVTGEDS
jgi:hypothetical protein